MGSGVSPVPQAAITRSREARSRDTGPLSVGGGAVARRFEAEVRGWRPSDLCLAAGNHQRRKDASVAGCL